MNGLVVVCSMHRKVDTFTIIYWLIMKGLHMVSFILLVVGGLNWLVFGLFGQDIVGRIVGGMDSSIAKLVYIVVGLAAIAEIATHKNTCKMCGAGSMKGGMIK